MDVRLPADVEATAFRIVQEALTNVAKHASASQCVVSLERLDGSLLVIVEDNGVGLDLGKRTFSRADQGLGLIGMRERVARFQGSLRLESTPGRGTRLIVEIPTGAPTPEKDTNHAPALAHSGVSNAAAHG
jgi:two-component system sensor histidine kinase DegS